MSQTWKWFIPLLFPVDWLALRHMTITNCKVETVVQIEEEINLMNSQSANCR